LSHADTAISWFRAAGMPGGSAPAVKIAQEASRRM
jgi:hypothetical protein